MNSFNDDILGDDFGLPIYTPIICDDRDDHLPAQRQVNPWPPKLPMELALGGDATLASTLAKFGATEDDYARWATMPAFKMALSDAAREMRENGVTFKRLCAGIAEDFLDEIDTMLQSSTVGFAVKMDAMKNLVKWGGLEPQDKSSVAPPSNMVNIQINL